MSRLRCTIADAKELGDKVVDLALADGRGRERLGTLAEFFATSPLRESGLVVDWLRDM
ncbi:MAG TPA: hypothetical protein VGZ00_01985 [Candidatus Baltobacteraceae bacterium]|nr:hypothetical protein [Candidatus Baltobacteraceae bacterium]